MDVQLHVYRHIVRTGWHPEDDLTRLLVVEGSSRLMCKNGLVKVSF